MARIQDSKVKETSGGYHRLFGIPGLGRLISRVQSTVISSGTELEHIIPEQVKKVGNLIDNLDDFISKKIMPDGVLMATKQQIKNCNLLDSRGPPPDFLIFKQREGQQNCHVVELKDGHLFDTKKANAERHAIHSFIKHNASRLSFSYPLSAHFCCFNQKSRHAIVTGFKGKINREEAMTGQEFCDLLEIDYDQIVAQRRLAQPENVQFFLQELVKIDELRDPLRELLLRNDQG